MTFYSIINYPSYLDLIEFVLIALILYVAKFYLDYFTRPNKFPGPIPLPVLGTLLWYNGNPAEWVTKAQEKYGDIFELYMGKERVIWLSNSDLITKIVSPSTNNNFLIRITPNQGLDEIGFTTKGITFNRNVESWKYNRKFFNQAIKSPKFLKQTVEKIQKIFPEIEICWSKLSKFDQNIQNSKNSNIKLSDINLSEWIPQFIMDLTFLAMTNKRTYSFANYYYNTMIGNKKEKDEGEEEYFGQFKDPVVIKEIKKVENFAKIIHEWSCAIQFFMSTPKLWRDYIPSYKRKANNLKKSINKANEVYLKLIKDRKQEIDRIPIDEQLDADTLTMFLTVNTPRDITTRADNNHTRPMSEEEILGNIFEIISGGVDTTSSGFCFIIYHVEHHPKVKGRMLKEIDSVFGKDPNRKIAFDDLNKLIYCEAIIKEVLRVMSIVPIIFRTSLRDDKISGHQFSGQTQFMLNTYGIHHNKEHWINPEVFNPSRFLGKEEEVSDNDNENGKNNQKSGIHKNSFIAFGGGPRMCPGKQLAMTTIKTIMVLLYRKYDVRLSDMNAPIKYHFSLLRNCDDLNVILKPIFQDL
ncbi:hypothetical protein Glove_265g13 [Diversispora epigaea]|uniref:Cytochrome P450 n=1 Tax=Diversispora epigaea TaxID=1348612 RepID=A0A397I579_9GLOM|nr:hypothetical protein Glove_265g13 [Diversispora epigaea]